jgi:hypothetical protein
MSLTLTVQTLKHVPLLDVCAGLPETLYDFVVTRLADSDLSWGNNANTFAYKGHVRNVIEAAWVDWRQDDDEDPELLSAHNAFREALAALDALPNDVFISLGD